MVWKPATAVYLALPVAPFSHDGRLLAVAESGGHDVLLWDVSAYTAGPPSS